MRYDGGFKTIISFIDLHVCFYELLSMFICDLASHIGVSVDIYGFHISHSVQLHVTGKPKYTAIDFFLLLKSVSLSTGQCTQTQSLVLIHHLSLMEMRLWVKM